MTRYENRNCTLRPKSPNFEEYANDQSFSSDEATAETSDSPMTEY
jgi:hypothetical protein